MWNSRKREIKISEGGIVPALIKIFDEILVNAVRVLMLVLSIKVFYL